jgi:hypothetical protein
LTDFHGDEAKKIQNGELKKTEIFRTANSQKMFSKFYRLVLGLVGLIDVKGIDVAQPIRL